MAVLQTKHIHICALKNDRKKILEALQRSGMVQIETGGSEDDCFRRMDTGRSRSIFEKEAAKAAEALKILDVYAPEKKGLFASLEGKKVMTREMYEKQAEACLETAGTAGEILDLNKSIAEAHANVLRAQASLEMLMPWMKLDMPMCDTQTHSTAAFVGMLPGQWDLGMILAAIAKAHPELTAAEVEIVGTDRDQTCIFAVSAKKDKELLEDALRVNGFVRPSLSTSLTPAEFADEIRQQQKDAEAKEQEACEALKGLAGEREKLQFAADYYAMRADKYEQLGKLLQSEHVFLISGYIPEDQADRMKAKLEQKYTCQVEISEASEEESAPVLLKNNGFAAPTEGVVEAFGLPNKGEIDPTSVMAFFYYFFFGLMLSDAGYGILMVIGCLWAVKKFPNMEKGLQKMLRMFFYCGISTTFWGIMFGGYFGDVVTVVASTFFNAEVTVPAVWFVPLEDPIKLLMFSFLFGIIHLFVGLGCKGYMLIRDKQWMDFFAGVLCWYVLLIGLILIFLPSDIFASMAGVVITFPAWVGVLSKWMSIISAVCIVLFSEMGTKNIVVRIALGAYDLYGVSSWLSDVLSYSRLLALGLATGVIGSVINTMGSMIGHGVIAFILFWIIFVVGHLLNMGINLLGAYVHTNRLQFVEFFGKFYEGGGRPFRPFSAEQNKYFKFKEEEKNG